MTELFVYIKEPLNYLLLIMYRRVYVPAVLLIDVTDVAEERRDHLRQQHAAGLHSGGVC